MAQANQRETGIALNDNAGKDYARRSRLVGVLPSSGVLKETAELGPSAKMADKRLPTSFDGYLLAGPTDQHPLGGLLLLIMVQSTMNCDNSALYLEE